MLNESTFETLESQSEWNEWNESAEFSERNRNRNRPLPRPNQGNATAHSPQAGYATKAELEATANRLDGRIAVNTKAITEVNGRVSSLGAAHNRLEVNVRKEVAERKTTTDALKQQTENMKMAIMLTPLISAPKTITQTIDGKEVKLLTDDGDTFRMLLPMLMMSGGFGGNSGTSGGSGGMSNDMMMPLMILAMSKK
jgi:hypothetical protein